MSRSHYAPDNLDRPDRWRDDAACREEDPELFFPIGTTFAALLQIEEAKAVCLRCPVIDACRAYALETGADGVWGGLSEDERRSLKRRAARNRARQGDS